MKKHRSLVILILTALVIVGVWFLLIFRKPLLEVPEKDNINLDARQESEVLQKEEPPVPSLPPPENSAKSQRETERRIAVEQMNVPITFYGKVVDQYSNGVPDTKVVIAARQAMFDPNQFVSSNHPKLERRTDAQGEFSIEGITGDSFSVIAIEKEGYIVPPNLLRGFTYFGASPYQPDRESPYVFRVWKKSESAMLITRDKDTRIPYDGSPVRFDVLTGEKLSDEQGGDLRVRLWRTPESIPLGYRNNFYWRAEIEAINGGLVESKENELMFAAPESGYQPKIEISMKPDATNWASTYGISFYAKTRGGSVYSRIHLEFRVDSSKPQTGFTITSSANPNGSRNLQP